MAKLRSGTCPFISVISLQSRAEPLIITNLRYYNWKQAPAEQEYDTTTDIVRLPAADQRKRGLVVSITADDFAAGDTVHYLSNHGIEGYFEAHKAPSIIKEVEGKRVSVLMVIRYSSPTSPCLQPCWTMPLYIGSLDTE